MRIKVQLGLVMLVMWAAAPAWATPLLAPPICEFASLPPSELLDGLAESYRGLLEFGGDGFSPDTTSLEKLFEPAAGRDQRSVAFNESLAKLGDWVLLEAEDQGLSQDMILARLREVVREYRARVSGEQARTDEAREEREDAGFLFNVFSPYGALVELNRPVFLDNGRIIATGANRISSSVPNLRASTWTASPTSLIHAFELPSINDYIAVIPLRLDDPDQILIQYVGSPLFEVWNWRTHRKLRDLSIGTSTRAVGSVSPGARFVAAKMWSHSALRVLDLQTGYAQQSPGEERELWSTTWSDDGQTLAAFFEGDHKELKLFCLYRLTPQPGGEFRMERVFSAQIPMGTVPKALFESTPGHFVLHDNYKFQRIRVEGDHTVHDLWTEYRPVGTGFEGEVLLVRDQAQVVEPVAEGFHVRNLETGDVIWSPSLAENWSTGSAELSPSQRLLAIQNQTDRSVQIWDLQTRTMVREFTMRTSPGTPFVFSDDETRLMMLDTYVGKIQLWNLLERGEHD